MSGPLFLIGGHEDRDGERVILRAIARVCVGGPLILVTAASEKPERYARMYADAFAPFGVTVTELRLADRRAADRPESVAALYGAGAVLISGGGQTRGAAILRGSLVSRRLRDRWQGGMPVAGSSAGAALMGEWMLGRSADDSALHPEVQRGLGLVREVLVDQHLAQRGRTPRLIAASTLKGVLGIGIDEDTAAVVRGSAFDVIGSGTVTVVDPTNATARRSARGVSVRGARLHVITPDDKAFDI